MINFFLNTYNYPTFLIFLITMFIEYCNLVITIVLILKNYFTQEKKIGKKRSLVVNRGQIVDGGQSTMRAGRQEDFDQAMKNLPAPKQKDLKTRLEYWKNHPFVVLEIVDPKKRKRNFRMSLNQVNRGGQRRRFMRNRQSSQINQTHTLKRGTPQSGQKKDQVYKSR